MLPITNNVFAGRLNEQGDVRLLCLSGTPVSPPKPDQTYHPADVVFDITIPASQWPTLVAHVARRGKSQLARLYYEAQALHQNVEPAK